MLNLPEVNQKAKENALAIQRHCPELPVESIKKLARFVTFAQLGIAEAEAFLKEKHGPDCGLSPAGFEMILNEAAKEA